MSAARRPSPARLRVPDSPRDALPSGWVLRLWERSQEMPDKLLESRAQQREERIDAAQRAMQPTWDLRLVPAALAAWAAALLGTAAGGEPAEPGSGIGAGPSPWAGAAVVVLVAVLGTILVVRRTRLFADWRGAARAAAPTVMLCLLIAAAVLVRAGAQEEEAAAQAQALGTGAQRIELEIADRPVQWHSAASSGFGPTPEEQGESATGVIVPVRLPDGAEATLFAQDTRWAEVHPGQRFEAVVADPEAASTDLQLSTSSPPEQTAEPGRDSVLDTATQRFALAAAARGPDAAGLLPGMTYGDRTGLDKGLEDAMKTTGLTHLTAVSGSNCALVMALAGHLALGLGLRRRLCVLVGLIALLLFVILVGPDPSVLRAAVMGGVAALAVLSGRGPVSLAALSAAMCALLVIDPWLGREFGFALSVCATAGIVVSGRPLTRVLERALPPMLALVLAIPLVAQLWCGPVMALLAPTVATYAVPANVVAAPVVPLVTVLGLSALILLGIGGPVGDPLGAALLHPGAWCVSVIARAARFFAGLPGSTAPWPPSPWGPVLMLVLSAGLVVAVHRLDAHWLRRQTSGEVLAGAVAGPISEPAWHRARRRERNWRNAGLAVIAVGILVVVAVLRWPSPEADDWSVLACDVGQGDAILLRGREPDRESTVLIDTGPDPGAVRSCLEDAGVKHLDLLVLTHDHADHTAGAEGLSSVVEIDQVWWSSATGRAPDELAAFSTSAQRPAVGQRFDGAGLDLQVLAPDPARSQISPESEDENNASIVLRAEVSDGADRFSVLAAGDLEESGLGPLLRADPRLLDVDLLKVSHHGARNGGTAIIDAATPQLAVVSVGDDNEYGHPHPDITQHLAESGIPVARTDQHGAVAIRDDGGRLFAVSAG